MLGVDVGYSATRRSSAACRLDWFQDGARLRVSWRVRRFRDDPLERRAVIDDVAGGQPLLAAAIDGPLAPGLHPVARYRLAERMLTRGIGRRIGRPGASGTPVGTRLNAAALRCADAVLETGLVGPAAHMHPVAPQAVAEAFPGGFLGLMLADPDAVPARRANRSDAYFEHLDRSGGLMLLLRHLLPGGTPSVAFGTVRNHDDRAALACALAALGLAAGDYMAVGDAADGWIVLPPPALVAGWAWPPLRANAAAAPPGCLWTGPNALNPS